MLENRESSGSVTEIGHKTGNAVGRGKTDGIAHDGIKINRVGNCDGNGQVDREGNGQVYDRKRQVSIVHDTKEVDLD